MSGFILCHYCTSTTTTRPGYFYCVVLHLQFNFYTKTYRIQYNNVYKLIVCPKQSSTKQNYNRKSRWSDVILQFQHVNINHAGEVNMNWNWNVSQHDRKTRDMHNLKRWSWECQQIFHTQSLTELSWGGKELPKGKDELNALLPGLLWWSWRARGYANCDRDDF